MLFQKIVSRLFITFLIIGVNLNLLFSQSFVYPVIERGSEEWKNLSPSEKLQISQIPEDQLEKLSTEELISLYLKYPFLSLIAAYNNWQTGFNRIYNEFNGLRELLQREDLVLEVMKYYNKMDPGSFQSSWTDYKKGEFVLNIIYIETLLSQEKIINQLTKSQKKQLLSIELDKYYSKQHYSELHGDFGTTFTVFSMGQIISEDNRFMNQMQSQDMEFFLNTSQASNPIVIQTVVDIALEIIQ